MCNQHTMKQSDDHLLPTADEVQSAFACEHCNCRFTNLRLELIEVQLTILFTESLIQNYLQPCFNITESLYSSITFTFSWTLEVILEKLYTAS